MTKKLVLVRVVVQFECKKCGPSEIVLNQLSDFVAHSDPCELCGSHGSIEVYLVCPKCRKGEYVELQTW